MSKQNPILNHSEAARQIALNPSKKPDVLSQQELTAGRTKALLAAIHDDLRARSTRTYEITQRSSATVSMTVEMIANSREAIAHSRDLLAGRNSPIRKNRKPARR